MLAVPIVTKLPATPVTATLFKAAVVPTPATDILLKVVIPDVFAIKITVEPKLTTCPILEVVVIPGIVDPVPIWKNVAPTLVTLALVIATPAVPKDERILTELPIDTPVVNPT